MPDPVPSPPANKSVPAKQIRRPTEKALQALEDLLPEGPGPLEEEPAEPAPIMLRIPRLFRTAANSFGLPRTHRQKSTATPDMECTLQDHTAPDIIWLYPNISSWLFGKWFWNDGTDKSKSSRKNLLDILLSGVFELNDLRGVNFDKIDNILGTVDMSEMQCEGNGWKTSTVTIKIPIGKVTKAARRDRAAAAQTAKRNDQIDPDADNVKTQKFAIPGFHHRSLVHIICSIIEFDNTAKSFHWHPYEQYWTPAVPWALPDRVIAGLMFWSDATHVAQFRQAKLWPIYAYFGNQSKYACAQPSARASSQVAYLQSLPDTVQDFIRQESKGASAQLLAHCRRELFHESWRLLLNDEFVEAYKHGIVLDCKDGVCRRVYPRIFTYSADYPEKVLIATLCDMGKCPCPRCKIVKEDIPNLGTPADTAVRVEQVRRDDATRRKKVPQARKYIYEDGYVVNSTKVDDLLKPESLVPTENAFSDRLDGLDFDIFDALVVDFMHETELGDFKSIIKHLIRILNTQGADVVNEFNESTAIGELQHRIVKRWNGRSNKNNPIPQIIKMDVLQAPVSPQEPIPLDLHHRIVTNEGGKIYLSDWLTDNSGNPAFKDFLSRLKAHLYGRMHNISSVDTAQFSSEQLATVNIQHNRVFRHATAAFNYTRYNVRRDQDTINAHTNRCHVMVKSNEDNEDGQAPHPYWYARVLGVFHVNVYPPGARAPHRFEFLWVRWFGRDPDWNSGPSHLRLDRIGYVPQTDTEVFGFLDPLLVLRAYHLVPAFVLGTTTALLGPSATRDFTDGDWVNYYVMRFVDRDMMMCYLGIGIGHLQPADFPAEVDTDFQALMRQYSEFHISAQDQGHDADQESAPHNVEGNLRLEDQPIHAEDIESENEEEDADEEGEGQEDDDNDKRTRHEEPVDPTGSDTETESDSEPGPNDYDNFEYQKHLRLKGRMAARIIDPFAHWPTVLAAGLCRDPRRYNDEARFTDKENEEYRIFQELEKKLLPNIREDLLSNGPKAPALFGKLLNKGGKGAHSTDISSVKAAVPRWYPTWSPPYNANMKHEMGFQHPDCGKWLCPANLDWEDKEIRESLCDVRVVPGPGDFNRGLFFDNEPDANDLMSGFLKGDTLIRAYNHIFVSPTTALAESRARDKSTVKGNAAQHDITEATLESICYVAHIIHFCYSSQNAFQAKGGNGLFHYHKYFEYLQSSLKKWPEADQKNLLTWWNEKIFAHANNSQPAKRADGSLSIAEQMAAQATVARAAAAHAVSQESPRRRGQAESVVLV
ncbi:hypothetical protein K438DRAFT_1964576 [Mycena galopus ATCC 62051]|nr:hypothetical protein K438DRAFT_1964576 [Mycena galopus ATCC 62051]